MKIRELMNTKVKTIETTKTVKQAADTMAEHNIGSLIVVRQKKLAGIITERDIVTKIVAEGKPVSTKVDEVMTKDVVFVGPEMEVEDAIKAMIDNSIKKLPVVAGGVLFGIVTITDIVKAEPRLLEQLAELFSKPQKKIAAG